MMTIPLENSNNSWVKAMVTSVKTKSRNGYKIIWCLFCPYDPKFDPALDKLSWNNFDGKVMQYAVAFNLYFCLSTNLAHTTWPSIVLFFSSRASRTFPDESCRAPSHRGGG